MAYNSRPKLIQWDGMRAVTIWGDEGWSLMSGNDKERPDTETFYTSRVAIVYRGMNIRANAVASIPFDLVNLRSGDVVDSSDDWQNECGFIPNPESLLWACEAALVVHGQAYIYQSKNGYNYPRIFKPLAPISIKYDVQKDQFSRQVNNQTIFYPSALDENGKPVSGETVVPIWEPDPDVEKGPPLKYPAKAAMQAMGVLFNLGDAATGFFKRGMLHTYVFRVPPGTQKEDKEYLEASVKQLLSGIKNAWRTLFINADKVEPVDIGGGLEELANVPLTREAREDVAIALGIPMSKLFTESAAGLGGGGVVAADDKRLILDTALPEWRIIARELNRQVFIPLGYKLEERHEKMEMFRENEASLGQTLNQYVDAFNKNPKAAVLLAGVLGITIPDDIKAQLAGIEPVNNNRIALDLGKPQINQLPPPSDQNETPNNPNSQYSTPEFGTAEKMAVELDKFKRKALKHIGQAVDFDSDILPEGTVKGIQIQLAECKTADDVKSLFDKHENIGKGESETDKIIRMLELNLKSIDK